MSEIIEGQFRKPRQMLAEQEYEGHTSIHDDETAEKLGFVAGPIEGPTHFSQFVPLLQELWGQNWLENGCLSIHFQNMCVEGDEVKAFVKPDLENNLLAHVWAEKADATPVLMGTATIPDSTGSYPQSELERRLARLTPPGKLLILEQISAGLTAKQSTPVNMEFEQNMGALYPFSLKEKLAKITETSPYYHPDTAQDSPWGGAIIPLEMISVLTEYSNDSTQFPTNGPAIGLFADLEVKVIDGPLKVGHAYKKEREIIAVSESKRTESYWVKTILRDLETGNVRAEVLLNHATLKASYHGYQNLP
ncbi:MAG: hypothetical protein HOL98_08700 [Gammaproteobacteria bacterium]|jgi:hypothetical protein|nr:hypothetical protein [Gammaproteobacteria bacterium]MBT5203519.1 hypothetical protein [Gammaproteobacteria bacterium]MBT5601548.1 hypothetical protein [Gammaproteobacteria bacterium]MBT6247469.1 hypothetical protein [Gammaproteobacteria bacterium]